MSLPPVDPPPNLDPRGPLDERRRARSADPLIALSRSFEATRRREGLRALVLADLTGLAIAGAGPSAVCEEIAARAAFLSAPRPANDTVPCRLDLVTRAFAVRRLRIDGVEILLCAEGGSSPNDVPLAEVAAACQRILGRARDGSSPG